ncbi:peptidoglycan-binding protein [Streptomyces sp. NPDC058391]|uniref:peptidoglycan-binding protein n=1 Tax=unclassified Streptomyces TaxID=2593676 RepID=UPI0036676958
MRMTQSAPTEAPSRLRSRRRLLGIVVASAVALSAAALAASAFIKSPAEAAAGASAPAPDVLTAPVERQVLKDSVILRGAVTASQTVAVTPAAGEQTGAVPVVTRLPVKTGDKISSGQVLVAVSGRPVFVLKGKLPAYRDLQPGSAGDDVSQLQQALAGLGHGTAGDQAGTFGPGTQQALSGLYAALGYEPLPVTPDAAEQVATEQKSVADAQRSVEDARTALSSAEGSARTAAERELNRAEEDLTLANQRLGKAEAGAGAKLPSTEVLFLEDFPARVESVMTAVGSKVTGAILTVSAGDLRVGANLTPAQQRLVRAGQRVTILSELTGDKITGSVESVAAEPEVPADSADGGEQDGSGSADGIQYRMTVQPEGKLPAKLAGQDVRLTVEAASTDKPVMAVPTSAVSASVDGGSTVTVLTDGGARRRVTVETGASGDGLVQVTPVSPATLSVGDKVVIGVGGSRSDTGEGR